MLPLYSLCRRHNFFYSILLFENSIVHLCEKFKLFSDFSGLKPNTNKCKIPGIGVLEGVQVAVCGMKCIDLRNEAMKILDIILLIQSENKRPTKFL